MGRGLNFKKIKDLRLEKTESSLLFKAVGDDKVLKELKKTLTVRNKSVYYKLSALKKEKIYWNKRKDFSDTASMKVMEINQKIQVLMDESEEIYYGEEDGIIYIPSGFWWLSDDIEDDAHLNTEVVPFYIDGLRPYQGEEGLAAEMFKYKRCTGVMGTGLGKTRVITTISVAHAKQKKRTMVVVPTDYLVGQMIETIGQFHGSVTGASSKRRPKLGTDIMACTVGTAAKYIDHFHTVVLDESHHSPATTWQNLLASAERVEYVYNLTATPFREDGLDIGIHSFGGPTVFERDVQWGIENDWLSPFDVHSLIITPRNKKGEVVKVGDKSRRTTAYKKLVGNSHFLSVVSQQLERAVAKKRKCIVLFRTLDPARAFRKICGNKYDLATADFKKPIRDFSEGKTNVLIATDKLISEGVDIPDADVLFLITQNSSDVITFQALGRVLRKSENKKKPMVVDCVPTGYKDFYSIVSENGRETGRGSYFKRKKVYEKIADSVKEVRFK